MTAWIIAAILSGATLEQPGHSLVGTWKLISASSNVNPAVFGRHPRGFLTYTADGRMMVIISDGGRQRLSVNDRLAAPASERADAFTTFLAYAGRYSFDGSRVVHHIEAASVENWVNTDVERAVSFEGDRLVLRTTPVPRAGVTQTIELKWERLK